MPPPLLGSNKHVNPNSKFVSNTGRLVEVPKDGIRSTGNRRLAVRNCTQLSQRSNQFLLKVGSASKMGCWTTFINTPGIVDRKKMTGKYQADANGPLRLWISGIVANTIPTTTIAAPRYSPLEILALAIARENSTVNGIAPCTRMACRLPLVLPREDVNTTSKPFSASNTPIRISEPQNLFIISLRNVPL